MRSLLLVAVIAVPAFSQTVYTWEDEDGVHYTDDPSQVPKKKKVEGVVFEPRAAPKSAPATVALAPTTSASTPEARSNEFQWRDAFVAAHRRIEALRESITALQASLPARTECVPQPVVVNANGAAAAQPVARCQVNRLYDQLQVQIGQKRVELATAESELEQLDRRASMVSVPREWRRGW